MKEQRMFVKKLTLKHKRENKTLEVFKAVLQKIAQRMLKPISFGNSLKKFNIEYQDQDESLVAEFNVISDNKERVIAQAEKHEAEVMTQKLREAYKL